MSALDSLKFITNPGSIVIVGASDNPRSWGGRALNYLLQHGYKGSVFPVNPKYTELAGLKCYPSIKEIPGDFDLVMIVVKSTQVMDILRQSHEKGCKGAIIVSNTFAESGAEGERLQAELTEFCRTSGLRVVGPNCIGISNFIDNMTLNCGPVFDRDEIIPGNVGMISQSGAIMNTLFDLAQEQYLGFSYIFSVGNQADLELADYLEFLIDNESTKIITLYVESIINIDRFILLAREALKKRKPVIIYKGGRTAKSRQIIASHTGAMAGDDRIIDALFKQCGVIRVHHPEDLFQTAYLFNCIREEQFPAGDSLGVLTVSGGLSGHITDRSSEIGLKLPDVSPETSKKLKDLFTIDPPYNPLDIGRLPVGKDVSSIIKKIDHFIRLPDFNCILFINQGYNMEAIVPLSEHFNDEASDKPFVLLWIAGKRAQAELEAINKQGVPVYTNLDRCIESINNLLSYTNYLQKDYHYEPAQRIPSGDDEIAGIFRRIQESGRNALTETESKEVLARAGFAIPAERKVLDLEEAVAAADEIGYPVAVKIISPGVMHKTEANGIRLNISNRNELNEAYKDIYNSFKKRFLSNQIEGLLIQKMVTGGYEAILGCKNHPEVGPVIVFGHGGIYTELYNDTALYAARYGNRAMIRDLIGQTKFSQILKGFRGMAPADIDDTVMLIDRFKQFSLKYQDYISEIDLNPIMISYRGGEAKLIDALIVLKQ